MSSASPYLPAGQAVPELSLADAELENAMKSYMLPDLIFLVFSLWPLTLLQPPGHQGSSGRTRAACARARLSRSTVHGTVFAEGF